MINWEKILKVLLTFFLILFLYSSFFAPISISVKTSEAKDSETTNEVTNQASISLEPDEILTTEENICVNIEEDMGNDKGDIMMDPNEQSKVQFTSTEMNLDNINSRNSAVEDSSLAQTEKLDLVIENDLEKDMTDVTPRTPSRKPRLTIKGSRR